MIRNSIYVFLFSLIAFVQIHAQVSEQLLQETMTCLEQDSVECDQNLRKKLSLIDRQSAKDSVYELLMYNAVKFSKRGYFEYGVLLTRGAIRLSEEGSVSMAEAQARMSAIYLFKGDLDSSLIYINNALALAKGLEDQSLIAKYTSNKGQIEKELGNYPQAMDDYVASIGMHKSLNDQKSIAKVQSEIASLLAVTGEPEEAILYNKQASQIFKSLGRIHDYAYSTLNMANDLIYVGRPDTALVLLAEVLKIYEGENDLYLQMNTLAQIGRAHFILGNSEDAIRYFNRSIDLDKGQSFLAQLAYNFEYLSRIYDTEGDNAQSLRYALKSYQLHTQLGFNEELANALYDLAISYENTGQLDSAIKYYLKHAAVSDSLFSIAKEHQLDALKEQYKSELKEEQIAAGKIKIDLLEQKQRAQYIKYVAIALGLSIVLIVAIGIISRQRGMLKHTKKLNEEKEKTYQAEIRAKQLIEERLQSELDNKKRELTSQALVMAEKNEMLHSFKNQLSEISERAEENTAMNQLIMRVDRAENKTGDWDKFMRIFEDVHPSFLEKIRLQFPALTANDMRLIALMRMSFSNKEIASILHISDSGLKKARYRLRKKMNLESEENMQNYILKM